MLSSLKLLQDSAITQKVTAPKNAVTFSGRKRSLEVSYENNGSGQADRAQKHLVRHRFFPVL